MSIDEARVEEIKARTALWRSLEVLATAALKAMQEALAREPERRR